MKIRKVFPILLVLAGLIGLFTVGVASAADITGFTDWQSTWFKVKLSENGLSAPALPAGGTPVANLTEKETLYFEIESFDVTTSAFVVRLCAFDGTIWAPIVTDTARTMQVLGGIPSNFTALYDFTYDEQTNITERFLLALSVKGKAQNDGHTISSASIKNARNGGVFLETVRVGAVGTEVTSFSAGQALFNATWIKPTKVDNDPNKGGVPAGCKVVIP
jgi:hypothetical protein